jgi:hypothetical protein
MPYYILYVISFIGLLVLLMIHDNRKENDTNILQSQGIIAVALALSLAFGFFCLICLLGWGLVKIPILWWTNSDQSQRLNKLMFGISVCDDKIINQQNKVNKLITITNEIQVESEIDLYKRMMIQNIESFTIDMQEYNFAPKSNSFLDMDTKTKEKYIRHGTESTYS